LPRERHRDPAGARPAGPRAPAARRASESGSEPRDAGDQGKTSHHLLQDRRKLRAEFWGRHLWARGYFVATSGNVTDDVIAEYIRLQGAEPQDAERFRITE
jgi:hypothetical protein